MKHSKDERNAPSTVFQKSLRGRTKCDIIYDDALSASYTLSKSSGFD